MTFKKLKPSKIAIVVFLTALIWVWADLAQDERLPLSDVRVEIAKSSNPALWLTFAGERGELDSQTAVTLDSVVLKGPAARVAKVKQLKNKGKLDLTLFLTEQEAASKTGVHPLDVLEFLKRSPEFRQLGLTVESCEPRQLMLRTLELVEESVPVECTGLDASVQVKSISPATVKAYVPKDETGIRKAIVRLTSDDLNRGKTAGVEKTPYIELAPGQSRDIPGKVKITLAPAQNPLSQWRVPAAVGLCFNQIMQGKYRVVLKNDPTELANVMIRATAMAEDAYAKMPFQLILYIQDSDRQATDQEIQRDLVFNWPDDYLQKDEIKADQKAPTARFTLEPVGEANAETGP